MSIQTIKTCVFSLFVVPLLGFCFLFTANSHALVVLQYHHISDSTPRSTSLSPKLFEQHLQYLTNNGFKVVDLKTVIRAINQKKPFTKKSVLITFDDGYRSIFDVAFPLLKKHDFPFVVFVNTDPVNKQLEQFMSWEELQILIDNGGAIANHSVSHPHMIRKEITDNTDELLEMVKYEIETADRSLKLHLSETHKAFAYPYGEYEPSVKKLLKQLGYIAFGQHSGAVPVTNSSQDIPRYPFGGKYGDMEDFKLKVNSLAIEVESEQLLTSNGLLLPNHLIPNHSNGLKLSLKFKQPQSLVISCYAPDGTKLNAEQLKRESIFELDFIIPVGRSRVNCTAPSTNNGVFHWFSIPLIKADLDGRFY